MKPARRSAGDPSRLTASLRAAHRCVSVGIHPVFLPRAPCQPGASPPPGGLAGLGAHVGSTTGCSPRRFAPLIVALRSQYTRASSPGGGSSLTRLVSRAPRPHREDSPASALTWVPPPAVHRVASRRSSLRFGRNTLGPVLPVGAPPSRALSAGRLAGLGAHAGSTTGCSPRRYASLIVALRSKYTRYSSLTRLVSRAPRRPRRSRHFVERLSVVECASCVFGFPLVLPPPRSAS